MYYINLLAEIFGSGTNFVIRPVETVGGGKVLHLRVESAAVEAARMNQILAIQKKIANLPDSPGKELRYWPFPCA